MKEIDVNKAFITGINIVMLLFLFLLIIWHAKEARTKRHLSKDWMFEIMAIFIWCCAFSCEIPAFWTRIKAYYVLKTVMPDSLYVLVTWDRWGHLFLYFVLFIYTRAVSRREVPKFVKDTLS
jgi:hypothetical protein